MNSDIRLTFATKSEMVQFIKSIPDSADFESIINTTYGIKIPLIYKSKLKSLYQVLAYNDFNGVNVGYVMDNILDLFDDTLDEIASENIDDDFNFEVTATTVNLNAGKKGLRRDAKPSGELKIFKSQHTNKWEAWIGNDLAANSPSKGYVKAKLEGYGYTATDDMFK